MNRWKYPSPKTIGILAAIGFIAYAAGPVVQHVLIRAGATALDTRLSIDRTSVSLFSSELEFTGVSLAHPLDSPEDRLACQSVVVDVEGIPLLRRKLVIRNATALGLRLLTSPVSAQEFATRWPLPQHWKLQLPAQKLLQASMSDAAASIPTDPLAGSRTLALLDVLSSNGSQQYVELEGDLGIYELRVERLAELAEDLAQAPPAEKASEAEQTAEQTSLELQALEAGVSAFRKRVEESHKKILSDRQRLLSLKEQDLSRMDASHHLQIPNSQVLSEFFLGAASSQRSWEIVRFVNWARTYLPQQPAASSAPRPAGLTLAFPERHPLPEFVLRALHFEGQGEVADQSFNFAGTLQNLTNDPRAFAQPTRLVLDAKVPHRVVVEAVMDRTGDVPRDRIVVRCPSWPQPEQMLGDPSQVGIQAKPSLLSLRAELNLSEGNISGIVQMRQQRLNLTPQVAGELGGERVQSALVEMLSQIETIDYEVKIDGPLDSPSMTLSSPWGERVAGGLQHAFEKELALRSAEQTQRLSLELDARIAQWEETAAAAQQELQARLATTLEQVQLLNSLVQRHLPQDGLPRAEVTLRPQDSPSPSPARK